MTKTESKWSERVRAWRASGLPASEFAASSDFEASTLRYWARRLKRAERPLPDPIRVVRVTPAASVRPALVVAVGSARIEVCTGFDRSLLRDVVGALGEMS